MRGKACGLQAVKREIIDYAHSIGIDSIGFTTADPFDELKQNWKAIIQKVLHLDLKNQTSL